MYSDEPDGTVSWSPGSRKCCMYIKKGKTSDLQILVTQSFEERGERNRTFIVEEGHRSVSTIDTGIEETNILEISIT